MESEEEYTQPVSRGKFSDEDYTPPRLRGNSATPLLPSLVAQSVPKRRKLSLVPVNVPVPSVPLRSPISLAWFDSRVCQLRLDAVKILLRSSLVVRAGSGAVATKLGQYQYEKMDHRKSSAENLSFHFHKKCRISHGWWSEVLSISKAADILRNYHPDAKVCIHVFFVLLSITHFHDFSHVLSFSTPTLTHMFTHT